MLASRRVMSTLTWTSPGYIIFLNWVTIGPFIETRLASFQPARTTFTNGAPHMRIHCASLSSTLNASSQGQETVTSIHKNVTNTWSCSFIGPRNTVNPCKPGATDCGNGFRYNLQPSHSSTVPALVVLYWSPSTIATCLHLLFLLCSSLHLYDLLYLSCTYG